MGELKWNIGAEPVPTGSYAQQLLDGVAKLVRRPLRVIGARLVDIANRDALDIRLVQEMKHHAQALSADADERNVDLIAGRDMADATEDVSRDDRETQRGRAA